MSLAWHPLESAIWQLLDYLETASRIARITSSTLFLTPNLLRSTLVWSLTVVSEMPNLSAMRISVSPLSSIDRIGWGLLLEQGLGCG